MNTVMLPEGIEPDASNTLVMSVDDAPKIFTSLFNDRAIIFEGRMYVVAQLKIEPSLTTEEMVLKLEQALLEMHTLYATPICLCLNLAGNNDTILTPAFIDELAKLSDFCLQKKIGNISVNIPTEVKYPSSIDPIASLKANGIIVYRGDKKFQLEA